MTKKELKKIKSIAPYIAMGVLLVLVAGGFAFAEYQEYQAAKTINVAGDYNEYNEAPMEVVVEESLGVFNPAVSRDINHNGLVTYMEGSSFRDGTTTIISFVNPFGSPSSTDGAYVDRTPYGIIPKTATATVDFINLDITGPATTSYSVACGASVDGFTSPTYTLLQTNAQATEAMTTTTVGVVQNNASSTHGQGVINGSDVAKILLTPDFSYFVCKVTTDGDVHDGAFTNPENTFDGIWKARIMKGLR